MSDSNNIDDSALQSKREEVNGVIKFTIAALSTVLGWKFLGTGLSPLDTHFGAIMLYISAVFVHVAAQLTCYNDTLISHRFIIGDVAHLGGQLASVALLLVIFWPLGLLLFGVWVFWFLWLTFRWLRILFPRYFIKQVEHNNSLPV